MKYAKALERIQSGAMTRADLIALRENAHAKIAAGDRDAEHVVSAINQAKPADAYVLFMGFCPGADFNDRLDIEWKAKGICRFDYLESTQQLERFNSICVGDLVVLKKREQFGKTMRLFGHGRVKLIAYDENDIRYLVMDWSSQSAVIEVPLMGCNSTVDVRTIEAVEGEMPEEFWQWLGTR
jgi:hypothetical protein